MVRFEYEISRSDYAASQSAYYKLNVGRRRVYYAVLWIAVGSFFTLIASTQQVFNWAEILLGATGLYLIYCGILGFFPRLHFRRYYASSGMVGMKFHATIDNEGFEVTSDSCTWRVPWSGVSFKDENKGMFTLYAAGTLFIFAKRYLSDDQQRELRLLARLPQNH